MSTTTCHTLLFILLLKLVTVTHTAERVHKGTVRPATNAQRNDIEKVTSLLAKGANITNMPPIVAAAQRNNKRQVESLLFNGANVNAKAKDGKMALNYAVMYMNTDMVELLMHHGADYDKLYKPNRENES